MRSFVKSGPSRAKRLSRLGSLSSIFALLSVLLLGSVSVASAEQPIKVRIAWQPAVQVVLFIAWQENLFEKEGLDPTYIRFNAAPPMFSSLRSDSIDIAYMGSVPAAIALSQNIPAKVFYVEADEGTAESLIARPDSNINTLSDLKGKTIGIWRGTSSDFALDRGLEKAGLTRDDVKTLNLDVTAIAPAFQKKAVDAVWVWDPWALELQGLGGKRVVRDVDVGVHMPDVWVGRNAWLDNPEGAKRFIRAMEKAKQILARDKELAARVTARKLNQTEEFASQMISRSVYPPASELLDPKSPISLNTDAVQKGEGIARLFTQIAEFMKQKNLVQSVPDMTSKIDTVPINESHAGQQ